MYLLSIVETPVFLGFPGGSDGKESSCDAGDLGLISGLQRFPGEGHGNRLQYSCLENPHGQRNLVGYSPWNSPGQNTEVGSLTLLQGIFPTQRSNPGLPHCRQILYQLSHKGSPRILEWVAYPSSGIVPTQELNQGLLYCRQILYQLSYQRTPDAS